MSQPDHNIKAIFFDGDATLWNFDNVMRNALQLVLVELSEIIGVERAATVTIDHIIKLRNTIAAQHADAGLDLLQIRRASFVELLVKFDVRDEARADHLLHVYTRHRFNNIDLYDDTIRTLKKLKQTYAVGLLSNGNNFPEKFGLAGLFDTTLFAEDCGTSKPDPKIFHEMLRRNNCAPAEAIHVGDSLTSDVQGAQRAGIPAIWLNRSGAHNTTNIKPDAVVESLDVLPTLISSRHWK